MAVRFVLQTCLEAHDVDVQTPLLRVVHLVRFCLVQYEAIHTHPAQDKVLDQQNFSTGPDNIIELIGIYIYTYVYHQRMTIVLDLANFDCSEGDICNFMVHSCCVRECPCNHLVMMSQIHDIYVWSNPCTFTEANLNTRLLRPSRTSTCYINCH